MTTDFKRSAAASSGGLPALWWGWVGAPAWWLAQFELRYAVVPWACRHGSRWIVLGLGAMAFVVLLALTFWMWSARPHREDEQPATFLQRGGVGMAAFFSLLILAQILPDFFLDPCRP